MIRPKATRLDHIIMSQTIASEVSMQCIAQALRVCSFLLNLTLSPTRCHWQPEETCAVRKYFVTIFLIIIICTHLKPPLSLSGILLPNTRPALIREHQIILRIKMLKKSPAAGKENESFPSEQRHSVSKLRRETLHWVHDNPNPDCGFNDAPPSFLLRPQSLCVQVHFKGSRS